VTPIRTPLRPLILGLALLATLVLSGCGSDDKDDAVQTVDTPVCHLVDPTLAAEVVGSHEFKTNGPGAIPRAQRDTSGAHCVISRDSGNGPHIQVRLGEVTSPEEWHDRLGQEAKTIEYGEHAATYTDDPGYGYGLTYEGGIYALGAGVNVLKGDRVIRVVVYEWPDATPDQRLEAAVKIARDADENLTAYDKAQG
jgi:hypothetical protein